MQRLSRGQAEFRSKLLTQLQAFRFAACLRHNPRFRGVELVESRRARHPERRWFVSYQPANPARVLDILNAQITSRLARAQQEGPYYTWAADPDCRFWHLLSLSGEVWEVDTQGRECNCPDHQVRCKPSSIRCKHLLAYDLNLGTYYTAAQWQTIPAAQRPLRDPERPHWREIWPPEPETPADLARPDRATAATAAMGVS